jgi:hypothetical protein
MKLSFDIKRIGSFLECSSVAFGLVWIKEEEEQLFLLQNAVSLSGNLIEIR